MDDEFRPLAQLRLDIDRAAHQINDALRDRHAQAGPLDLADRVFAFIRFEHLRGELGAHAHAAVLHGNFVRAFSVGRSGLLQPHADFAAFRREFIGVADEIQQDAVQAVRVAKHHLVLKFLGLNDIFDLLHIHLHREKVTRFVQQLP